MKGKYQLVIQCISAISLLYLSACSAEVLVTTPPLPSAIHYENTREITVLTADPTSILSTLPKSTTLDFSAIGQPVLISDKFIFAEGPVWDRTRNLLLFSDINANRIYKLTLPDTITVFREPSNKANGLTFDTEGSLLAAEHGTRSITRTLPDNTIEKLVDSYQGKLLNSPNDLVVRTDNTIYFTDPTFGLENRPRGLNYMGLYRISPSGEVVLEGSFDKSPNGVALSPDQKTLYLALTSGNKILAFDVAEDGATSQGRTFADMPQPDGMAVDIAGNLYIAGLEGVYVFSPDGTQLGKIKTDRQPTNCEFGGPDGNILFITAREALYRLEVPIPGFRVP